MKRSALLGAAFALLCGLLTTVVFAMPPGDATADSSRRVLLGATKNRVEPNCGRHAGMRECMAEGNITGYQVFKQGHRGRSFVVPYRRGKVIAWTISLSNPTKRDSIRYGAAQMPYFNELFGTPARAGISILRQVNKGKKGNPRYRLVNRSRIHRLNPYFGTRVKFVLTRPMNVVRGDVVALTIPTWAPAFWTPYACSPAPTGGVVNPRRCVWAQKHNTWRGSRSYKRCAIGTNQNNKPNEALRKSRPHQKIDSRRRYGCYYDASQLLYTATVVAR